LPIHLYTAVKKKQNKQKQNQKKKRKKKERKQKTNLDKSCGNEFVYNVAATFGELQCGH
jgi:hypothetical protein